MYIKFIIYFLILIAVNILYYFDNSRIKLSYDQNMKFL